MIRVLVSDTSSSVADNIARRLKGSFLVQSCCDGNGVLKSINEFDPDIIVLDMMLPYADGLGILNAMRGSGNYAKVIAVLSFPSAYVMKELARLGVQHCISKPYFPGCIVSQIYRMAAELENASQVSEEMNLAAHLASLGFQCGRRRYDTTKTAIMLRYRGENGSATKILYPEVAKICGGDAASVEKSIRDAIHSAWKTGNREIWKLYFPQAGYKCPTNDTFVIRLATAIADGEKVKKTSLPEMIMVRQA